MSPAAAGVLLCVFLHVKSQRKPPELITGAKHFLESQEVAICFPPIIVATASTAGRQGGLSRG